MRLEYVLRSCATHEPTVVVAARLVNLRLTIAPHADCWEEKSPPRDPVTHELRGDHVRFASGMKALGDYVHAAGLSFAMVRCQRRPMRLI